MKLIKYTFLASAITLGVLATSAEAATCLTSDITGPAGVSASSCAGYVAGNIFSNGGTNNSTVTTMLSDLGFDASSLNFGTLYSDPGLKIDPPSGATTLSFSGVSQLFGDTFIGIHWGGKGGGQSAIYKLDLTSPTDFINIIGQNPGGTSNAVLFSTTPFNGGGVPEPATWAMMIMGFGLVGATLRHRQAKIRFA